MADDVFGIVGTVQGGAFRVDQVVAEGGFAVVYRAYHGAFRSSVALKCLKIPGALSDSDQKEFLEQFREEAELLFRLSSAIPSVVRPLHVGTLANPKGRFAPFIALEWLEGQTLSTLISNRAIAGKPPLDLAAAVKLLTPAADALCRAHKFPTAKGPVAIVHRDMKPENVFIVNMHGKEVAKILDFGIAKVKAHTTQMVGRQSAGESPMSAFTPAYGAPEQWIPKTYGQTGPWTDVWGLALTVVETLCGHVPIEGEVAAMMGSALNPARRPTPRAEGVAVTDDVEAVFTQALAVDPRERFHDVGAFWNALSLAAGLPPMIGDSSPSLRPASSVPERTPSHPSTPGNAVPDLVVGAPQTRAASALEAKPPRPAPPDRASTPPSSRLAASDPNSLFGGSVLEAPTERGPEIQLQTGAMYAKKRVAHEHQPFHPPVQPVNRSWTGGAGRRKLGLEGPIKLFAVAIVLMAGDYVYASITGEVPHLGPARMVWLAGPIAAAGVYQLFARLLSATE